MKSPADDEPVLTSADLLAHRRAAGGLPDFPPPHAVIFAPQKSLAAYALRRHLVRRVNGFMGEFYLFKRSHGRIALSTGFGIGAPVVAGLADEFAALGVRQFVLIGYAGALQPELISGSLVIAAGALRGEGVSRHYLPPGDSVPASPELATALGGVLRARGQAYTAGPVWTTDAPFRELHSVVLGHQQAGVLAVDMEAAALYAVAHAHGLAALAAFSIADRLDGGRWRMDADLRPAQLGSARLFDAAVSLILEQAGARGGER